MRVTDEMVEMLAKWLHDEVEWPEYNYPERSWPQHEGDTGQRGDGWLKIVPPDVCEQFRDIARRLPIKAALAVEGTPQVKALEWLESRRPVKTYWAQDERGDLYWINQAFGSDSYYFTTVRRSDGATLYDGDDLGSAKAAAQADYENRVLSCLEYTTPPAGIREALGDWRPVTELPQDGDDTYLVTIEQTGKTASNKGARFVEKAWICPAENSGWLDPEGKDIEIAGWRVVSFKSWPEPDTALRGQS